MSHTFLQHRKRSLSQWHVALAWVAAVSFTGIVHGQPVTRCWQEDPSLETAVRGVLKATGLDSALEQGRLGVTVIDLCDTTPLGCSLNGSKPFYAASIAKTLVLCSAFRMRQEVRHGHRTIRPQWTRLLVSRGGSIAFSDTADRLLRNMIRSSSNQAATSLINSIGLPYIDSCAVALGLHDAHSGGLWLGAPFGPGPSYRRDPVSGLSHACSADALAHLFALLAQHALVDSTASVEMRSILGRTNINNRFHRALRKVHPDASIYRKTGTWCGGTDVWAHEACLVERGGVRYVAAVTCRGADCPGSLDRFIVPLDAAIAGRSNHPSPTVR